MMGKKHIMGEPIFTKSEIVLKLLEVCFSRTKYIHI